MSFPKMYYLRWILKKVFAGNPVAEFSSPQQVGKGWVCVLTDKVNGQEYLCSFMPVEHHIKIVPPETIDQLLNMNSPKDF